MDNVWTDLLCGHLGKARSVFDVSKGHVHYGPNGSYHHFLGRCSSLSRSPSLSDSLDSLILIPKP
jgi:hypothetical protein